MNGILIVNKPTDWTSHDVIAKLRGVLRERRAGHGGTLDPMATGVLPVFVGRATRAVQFCENADKEYIAGFLPGVTTDTQDITGTVITRCGHDISEQAVLEAIQEFRGPQKQIPPMYSAVKIGGKKLYELARRGIEAERAPRDITIHELELIGREGDAFLLRVVCSKGTYIRTLCHDIGAALGCGAVMSSLIRTRSGAFRLSDALTMEDIISAAESGNAEGLLRPVDSLFAGLPSITLSAGDAARSKNGVACRAYNTPDGQYRVYSEDGEFLMLGQAHGGTLAAIKNFFEVSK